MENMKLFARLNLHATHPQLIPFALVISAYNHLCAVDPDPDSDEWAVAPARYRSYFDALFWDKTTDYPVDMRGRIPAGNGFWLEHNRVPRQVVNPHTIEGSPAGGRLVGAVGATGYDLTFVEVGDIATDGLDDVVQLVGKKLLAQLTNFAQPF